MGSAIAAQIRKANTALMDRGDADAIKDYFSPKYIAHATDKDIGGGHALIACMRVEWPIYGTKHVIGWTLLKGDIVHPPKGKACEADS